MQAQYSHNSIRRAFVAVLMVCAVVAAVLGSPVRVSAQSCAQSFTIAPSTSWFLFVDGICPDLTGYRVTYSGAVSGLQRMEIANDPDGDTLFSVVHSGLTPGDYWYFGTTGDWRLRNKSATVTIDVVIELAPEATATPTLTPEDTATPTEVIVTATPSPTPTVDPIVTLQERADQSFKLDIFAYAVLLFFGLVFITSRR